MNADLINAIESLSEAVTQLRWWISDHRAEGQDTSSLIEVDESLCQCDQAIQEAKQKLRV